MKKKKVALAFCSLNSSSADLSSYKIIVLLFIFHFRNSDWTHCWEPSQSQRNSPQWCSCSWAAQELLTKSSRCCSWARPLPGCNGSFKEVRILLGNIVGFFCDCMNMFLDFLFRICHKRGSVEGRRMRANCTQIAECAQTCVFASVCAYGLKERRWEQKLLTLSFVRDGTNCLLTVAMSCKISAIQPPYSALWHAQRTSLWSNWYWDK